MTGVNLFDNSFELDKPETLPKGLLYQPELIERHYEQDLIARVSKLSLREFEFHGYKGNRRTISFGWQYEFTGAGQLRKAADIPDFFLPLRFLVAAHAGVPPESLEHVLVIEYRPGTGIGWHRDKAVFGNVIGVSLLAPCILRFRRKLKSDDSNLKGSAAREKTKWQRANLLAEPRSGYFLRGAARAEWEHSILRVDSLRYSVTFRELR